MYETRSQKKKNGFSVKDSRHLKNQGKSNNDNNNGDNNSSNTNLVQNVECNLMYFLGDFSGS